MELASAKGTDVAQLYTLARLTLLCSAVQLFTPPLSTGAADITEAKGFIGACLRKRDRYLEDEKVAACLGPSWKRERSPIGISAFHGKRARPRAARPANKGRSHRRSETLAIRVQDEGGARSQLAIRDRRGESLTLRYAPVLDPSRRKNRSASSSTRGAARSATLSTARGVASTRALTRARPRSTTTLWPSSTRPEQTGHCSRNRAVRTAAPRRHMGRPS